MGNVRLSYSRNTTSGSAEALEENSYYPFGLKQQTPAIGVSNPAYKYQYNGKELQQETGWNDYGWRQYMPEIGRWNGIDPLAEYTPHVSPYHYANNNPLSYNDPTGMLAQSFMDQIWSSPHGTTWYNTGIGFTNNWGSSMDYDGNSINWGSDYTNSLLGGAGAAPATTYMGGGGGFSIHNNTLWWWTNPSGMDYAGTGNMMKLTHQVSESNNYLRDQNSNSGWGNVSPWATAWATSGVLLADDATVVGVADDVAILGVLAGALIYDANYRIYVTYTLTGPNGQKYAGRASGFGDPNSIMMNRFSMHHMRLAGYGNPVLDASAQGYPTGYSAIRGREQQLIDFYGGVGSPNVGNSIRGVSKINPYGRVYHSLSNTYFGSLAPFTGY